MIVIMDIDGTELTPGDMVVVTKRIKQITDVGEKREVLLDDGTKFTIMESETITISTHEIKVTG